MRALLALALSWAALKLALLARSLTPPRPVPPPVKVDVHPELRRTPERYVRELVRLDLARADGWLCLVLGTSPVVLVGGSVNKIADPRWRQ